MHSRQKASLFAVNKSQSLTCLFTLLKCSFGAVLPCLSYLILRSFFLKGGIAMRIRWILSGAVMSFIITFIIVFIIAAAEYSTGLSEGAAQVFAYVSAAVGVFAGAAFSAAKSGTKALINAMPVSLIYIAVIISVTLVFNKRINMDIHCISLFAGIIFAGFLGAVCGQKR